MKNSIDFLNGISKRLLVFALPLVLLVPFVLPNAALADELADDGCTPIEDATISGVATKTYTGKALTQSVTVKIDGEKLIKGTDFKVSYSNNTYPGKAKITVSGIGDFDGAVSKSFTIKRIDGTDACVAAIVAGVMAHKSSITLPEGLVSSTEYSKAWKKIISGAYGPFRDKYGMKTALSSTGKYSSKFGITYISTIKFNYFLTKTQVAANIKTINSIAAKAKKVGASNSARIKYVHDYLVKNTAYSTAYSSKWAKISSSLAHTSYGCLQKHRAYCDGYSLAFIEICKVLGISGTSVVACLAPSGGGHAIAKIGSYYYDVTWDDPVLNGKDKGTKASVSHTYYKRSKTWLKSRGYRF